MAGNEETFDEWLKKNTDTEGKVLEKVPCFDRWDLLEKPEQVFTVTDALEAAGRFFPGCKEHTFFLTDFYDAKPDLYKLCFGEEEEEEVED